MTVWHSVICEERKELPRPAYGEIVEIAPEDLRRRILQDHHRLLRDASQVARWKTP